MRKSNQQEVPSLGYVDREEVWERFLAGLQIHVNSNKFWMHIWITFPDDNAMYYRKIVKTL